MKDALKIYALIHPFSSRKGVMIIGVIGAVVGTFLLLLENQQSSDNPYLGLGYLWYFPFLIQMFDAMFLDRVDQAGMKCLLLEMRNQNSIFNTGLILLSTIETIACLAIVCITMVVCMPFFGFHVSILILCFWFGITSGILCLFFVLAKSNNHMHIATTIIVVIFMIFFGLISSDILQYTIHIPNYLFSVESLPLLGLIWLLSFPIANAYGKYCYKNRKENKQARFAKGMKQ